MYQEIYSRQEYINLSLCTPGNGDRVIVDAIEPAVPLCETDCSKCGGFLLKNPQFRLVRGDA